MSVSTEFIENLVASGIVHTTSTVNATSTSTGSVIISGGGGVALDWYVGGTLTAADINGPGSIPAGLGTNAIVKADGAGSITDSSISDSGTLVTIANPVSLTDTTAATSSSTGSLVIAGGLGLAGDLFVGGAVDILATASSTSTSTGSLVLAGGIGIAENAFSAASAVSVAGAENITFPLPASTTDATPLVVNIPAAFSPLLRIGAVPGAIICKTDIVAYSSSGSAIFAAVDRFRWDGAAATTPAVRPWVSTSRDVGLHPSVTAKPVVVGSAPFIGLEFTGFAATTIKWAAKVSLTYVSS